MRRLRIGTRGSALALVQARWTAARLAELGVPTDEVVIRTAGDDRSPGTAWGEGAFVTRITEDLAAGAIDVAVHSAKDLPTDEDPGLVVAAYPSREDPRDALVARAPGTTLASLPDGARVGTDSPRRTAFLRAIRPDLRLHPLDGNVDTRLVKLDDGQSDALVLAVAGLRRLGRADRISEVLPPEVALPAPGQGSLAIQVRAADAEALALVARIDDAATRIAVEAERAFLAATGGGCRAPIGALGTVAGGRLTLRVAVARSMPYPAEPIAWLEASGPGDDRLRIATCLASRVVELRDRPRVLVTRPDEQVAELVSALEEAGIEVVVVPAIGIQPSASRPRLAAAMTGGPLDAVVFTTRSTVRGLLSIAAPSHADRLRSRPAVCIGEPAAAVARTLGFARIETAPGAADLAAVVAGLLRGFAPAPVSPIPVRSIPTGARP
jgi:hydroxymethylbilane synthase